MDNFMTYEYNSTKPFDLSSETIIMLGRADDKNKRFYLGIQAMEYIIKEKLECEMKIISYINKNTNFLMDLSNNINLKNNIKFVGFTSQPEKFFKNASLHIMPSTSESFSLAVGETKIYGIPTIILGLNYLSISNFGTIILYDDTAENIAKEALKILNNEKYRKRLGKQAKQSMKKFNNKLLLKKWIKLILCIYSGDIYYQQMKNMDKKLNKKHYLNILNKQLYLIKKKKPFYNNINVNNLLNFSFLVNINLKQ